MFTIFSPKTLFVFLQIFSLALDFTSSFADENKYATECSGPFKGRKEPLQKKEIDLVLSQHALWLKHERLLKNVGGIKHEGVRANFCGADLTGKDLSGEGLSRANLTGARLAEANLTGAYLEDANLTKAILSFANLTGARLAGANLEDAGLLGAKLREASLYGANLTGAYLEKANLQQASLRGAGLPKPKYYTGWVWSPLKGANLKEADISEVDLDGVIFDLKPDGIPLIPSLAKAFNLLGLAYPTPPDTPHSLIEIRNGLKKAGMRDEERILTYVIKHGETELMRGSEDGLAALEGDFLYILFEFTSHWGLSPIRPLQLLLKLILIFGLPYSRVVALSKPDGIRGNTREGIWVVRPREDDRDPMDENLKAWESLHPGFFFPNFHKPFATKRWWWIWGFPSRAIATLFAGLYFSVLSAFHIGWRSLNMGSWLSRLQPRDFALRATGRVKLIAGLQSLISVYLLGLWLLTYFGRPFE